MNVAFYTSGSVHDFGKTPNVTPKGFEIKKDELYVLDGALLIQAYFLILNQRYSALQILSKTQPTDTVMFEEYLALTKHINSVLNDLVRGVPLVTILQAQEESRIEIDEKKRKKKEAITLKDLLDKFRLSTSNKDELPPSNGDSPEKE